MQARQVLRHRIDRDALGVEVVRRQRQRAVHQVQAAGRAARVTEHHDRPFVAGADHPSRVDPHPHVLQALVEVDAVAGGVEAAQVSTSPPASSSMTAFGGRRPPSPRSTGSGRSRPLAIRSSRTSPPISVVLSQASSRRSSITVPPTRSASPGAISPAAA
ncbi:MAG: hypothetical protein H6648_02330 [Caldilineae bacterium]|nr:hypothetical protein [Caldilineae bacterium]